jgi:hypothetical protein
MKRLLSFLLIASSVSFAGTITIPSGSTQPQIQKYFNSATSTNNLIAFSAGTYNIFSSLKLPCIRGGVTITGPAIPPTYTSWGTLTYSNQKAILSSSNGSSFIFNVSGCTNPITINYLQFANAGAIYVAFPSTNLTFEYNSIVSIPCHSSSGCSQTKDEGMYFDGRNNGAGGTTLSNLVVEWNQIGDPNSCLTPANIMTSTSDTGGYCSGMWFQGNSNGVTIENNSFYHLEEGVKSVCFGDHCNGVEGTSPVPIWSNWTIKNNDFQQIHRMNAEFQPQGAANVVIQNNSIENPYQPQKFSFGLSLACCAGGAPYGLLPANRVCTPSTYPTCASNTPATSPVPQILDNVLVQNEPPPPGGYAWGYTIEWWGWGAQAIQNLLEGNSVNGGVTWGAGSPPWEINYNTTCGPHMKEAYASEGYRGIPAPSATGNTFSSTCSTTKTTMPTISPTSGGQDFPLTVTITDAGNTSSTTPVPMGNVSIWYTTDGSSPAPNAGTSRLCNPAVGSTSCNISLAAAGTVKAIGMWGQGANVLSYPSGYAFVPSPAASASYTARQPQPVARKRTQAKLP